MKTRQPWEKLVQMIRHGNWCLTNSLNKIGNSNCS
jgi:hypothetical protein